MNSGLAVEKAELILHHTNAESAKSSASAQWAALGAIILASCGHLLIKVGVTAGTHGIAGGGLVEHIGHYLLQPGAIAGLGTYGAGTLLWIYAVSRRNISFLYPLSALTYVIVALGGKFMFAESISSMRWLGIGVVALGVAMLQLSAKGEKA